MAETSNPMINSANLELQKAAGQYEQVLIIGYIPNGMIRIGTNVPNYGFLHSLLNETIAELVQHKRDGQRAREEVVYEPTEGKVAELVEEAKTLKDKEPDHGPAAA